MITHETEHGELVYTVAEGETRIQSYEVAAWWATLELDPGTYPVTFTDIYGHTVTEREGAYWANVTIPATRTEVYTPSLFAGVQMGSQSWPKTVNERTTYHIQAYAYEVAK